MPYKVEYSHEAVERLKNLRAFDRAAILEHVEQILMVNPTWVSKARAKRLREPAPTQYRLRVGEYRLFPDVDQQTVYIIKILSKEESLSYLGEELR
jgi:mRNA-degrading endonuclease RelE of RelBE toxin-antitoxin system